MRTELNQKLPKYPRGKGMEGKGRFTTPKQKKIVAEKYYFLEQYKMTEM